MASAVPGAILDDANVELEIPPEGILFLILSVPLIYTTIPSFLSKFSSIALKVEESSVAVKETVFLK